MQKIHAFSPKLRTAARLCVEVVLPLAAHHYLAALGNLEPFGE